MYLHGDGGSRIYAADGLDKSLATVPGQEVELTRDQEELKAAVAKGLRFRCRGVLLVLSLLSPAACAQAQDRPAALAGIEVGPQRQVSADLPNLPHVEPVIAVNPRDPRHLVAAAIVIRDPKSDRFNDTWTVQVLVSTDGGASWTRRELPRLEGTFSADPWLAWADDGTLYLSCIAQLPGVDGRGPIGAWLYRSADGGHTWSEPEPVPFAHGRHADHPVLRAVPGGGVHVFATGDAPDMPRAQAETYRGPVPHHRRLAGSHSASDRGALEPIPGYRPETDGHMGSGVAFGRGRFVLSYSNLRSLHPSTLWAAWSSDSGRSYQRVVITEEHVPLAFTMMALGRPEGSAPGRVYTVWTRSFERPHVMIGYSDDYGATWSAPRRVHADSSAALRIAPTVAVSNTGAVAVVWVESRLHEGLSADSLRAFLQQEEAVHCWNVYAAVSRDGAQTFSSPIRLTPETTCSNAAGNGEAGRRWRWGGDYIGVAWDQENAFYAIWADGRTGVYQVWTAMVEVK